MDDVLNIPEITRNAETAGIHLSDRDLRMLARIKLMAARIRNLSDEEKFHFGIPKDVTPQLKLGWEFEFWLHSPEKLGKVGYLNYLQKACKSCHKLGYEVSFKVADATKLEAKNEAKPIEASVMEYFRFRSELAEAAKTKGWDIERLSNHLHYSLCDQNGKTLADPDNLYTTELIQKFNENLLEAIHDCMPLMAKTQQMVSTKINVGSNELRVNYEGGRDGSVIVECQDRYYAGNEGSPGYHHELRRTHPGPDNPPAIGVDPFIAATTLLTGSAALAAEGREAKALPAGTKVQGNDYLESCKRMWGSHIAKDIFGRGLRNDIADYLMDPRNIAKSAYLQKHGHDLLEKYGIHKGSYAGR